MDNILCEWCDASFIPYSRKSKFCSSKCKIASRSKKESERRLNERGSGECKWCSSLYVKKRSDQMYCCRDHKNKACNRIRSGLEPNNKVSYTQCATCDGPIANPNLNRRYCSVLCRNRLMSRVGHNLPGNDKEWEIIHWKVCPVCNSSFRVDNLSRKFCSKICVSRGCKRDRGNRPLSNEENILQKICPCGKSFIVADFNPNLYDSTQTKSQRKQGRNSEYFSVDTIYCSSECQHRANKLSNYTLTPIDFYKKYELQDGKCAICAVSINHNGSLHIDHDHNCCAYGGKSCGKCIRGLLCNSCNTGMIKGDDPYILMAKSLYIMWWKEQKEVCVKQPNFVEESTRIISGIVLNG